MTIQNNLNLGNLISAAAVNYPGCTADQINGQSFNMKLSFQKDNTGNIQAFYYGTKGKEDFNLGILFREAVISLNQCKKLK